MTRRPGKRADRVRRTDERRTRKAVKRVLSALCGSSAKADQVADAWRRLKVKIFGNNTGSFGGGF